MLELDAEIGDIDEVRFHSRKHNLVRLSRDRTSAKWLRETGSGNQKKFAFTTQIYPGTRVTLTIPMRSEVPENPNDIVTTHFTFINIEPYLLTPGQLAGIEPIPNDENEMHFLELELTKYHGLQLYFEREDNSYRIYCTRGNITKKLSHMMQDFNERTQIYIMMRTSDGVELELSSTRRID